MYVQNVALNYRWSKNARILEPLLKIVPVIQLPGHVHFLAVGKIW